MFLAAEGTLMLCFEDAAMDLTTSDRVHEFGSTHDDIHGGLRIFSHCRMLI